jgi:hypothetical protein
LRAERLPAVDVNAMPRPSAETAGASRRGVASNPSIVLSFATRMFDALVGMDHVRSAFEDGALSTFTGARDRGVTGCGGGFPFAVLLERLSLSGSLELCCLRGVGVAGTERGGRSRAGAAAAGRVPTRAA